jgi:hypothetical protein
MHEKDVENRWAVDFILMLSKMDRMILPGDGRRCAGSGESCSESIYVAGENLLSIASLS